LSCTHLSKKLIISVEAKPNPSGITETMVKEKMAVSTNCQIADVREKRKESTDHGIKNQARRR